MKLPYLENVVLTILFIFFSVVIFLYAFGEFTHNVLNRIPERSLAVQEGMNCNKQEGMSCNKHEGMGCQKKSQ
jgi:hypothetical protein